MTLSPLLVAPLEIQLHVIAALISVFLGPFALYRNHRDRVHKTLGYVWVSAMFTVAVSALFIADFGGTHHFGLLHGFSVITLASLFFGLRHAILRNFAAHRAAYRGLYWNGLLIAGAFNFLPGRRINRSLLGENGEWGWAIIAGLIVLLIWRGTYGWRSATVRV